MRLIGMLNFFDDDPDLLGMSVERACRAGVDIIVAVDGPYDLFPAERDYSPRECLLSIVDAAKAGGCEHVHFFNKLAWAEGNEVEKRNFMLDRALEVAEPKKDWLLVLDSDHLWNVHGDLKMALATTGLDHAEVRFADGRHPNGAEAWYEARLLNRAVPGMRYDGAHWRIRKPDGSTSPTLRAGAADTDAPALDLRAMASVWHAHGERGRERASKQGLFYKRRDEQQVEV